MFNKRSSKQAAVVGLDLDAGHIAAAEATVNGSLSLKRGAVAHLRPGIMRDGEVADGAGLAEALRAMFSEHELPNRVRLGIANQRIVVRTLDLPPFDDDDGARRRRQRGGAGSHPDADGRGRPRLAVARPRSRLPPATHACRGRRGPP